MSFDKDKGGFSVTVTPKTSLLFGAVLSVLLFLSAGFFVMLWMFMDGRMMWASDSCGLPQVADAPPEDVEAPAPSPAPSRPAGGAVKKVSAEDQVIGESGASVTIIEYSDFECPFCGRFHPTMKRIMDEFDGQVRWVYRHFPLQFHAQARPAAIASECAGEQGKFWEFADGIFENQTRLGSSLYGELADELGLNRSKFDDCVKIQKYGDKVDADFAEGAAAGVTGTPGSFIVGPNGSPWLVPGAVPYEQLRAMVEAAL
jgi:protein-disulfide isomerase